MSNNATATVKAIQFKSGFSPVFFFDNGKVLISALCFKSANEALECAPHDSRFAVSAKEFQRYNGHRVIVG